MAAGGSLCSGLLEETSSTWGIELLLAQAVTSAASLLVSPALDGKREKSFMKGLLARMCSYSVQRGEKTAHVS